MVEALDDIGTSEIASTGAELSGLESSLCKVGHATSFVFSLSHVS